MMVQFTVLHKDKDIIIFSTQASSFDINDGWIKLFVKL